MPARAIRLDLIWIKVTPPDWRQAATNHSKGAPMDLATTPLAWGLTRGMARTLGVNLIEAVTDGWYSRAELSQLVAACAACGATERCTSWLAKTTRADALPGYCNNKTDIEALSF
jgi:hypothetical protein